MVKCNIDGDSLLEGAFWKDSESDKRLSKNKQLTIRVEIFGNFISIR